jgi:phosphoglycolate phosphatase-like HAD superfamily hydrolase
MLVLFDIDGTLLLTRGLGVECVRDAMQELFRVPIDVYAASFPGGLDPLIWRELCALHGLPDGEEHHARFRGIYRGLLERRIAAEPARTYALPGVPALLDALERVEGLTLGLLTGNYEETGRMKIAAAGLDPARFAACAWGSDAPERRGLPAVAVARHRAATGRALEPRDVLIVGDTPRDVDCALAHGARVLAVATGRYGVEELRAAGAERVVASLEDTLELVRWIARRE